MTNISIFAKPAFLNTNPYNDFISKEKSYKGYGHLQRVSSMIRGDQIVEALGAKLNPKSGYEDDVCIYVKPHVKKGEDFTFKGKRIYVDIIDGHNLGQLLLKHKEVGLIVCSKADYDIMEKVVPNKMVLIPQHHCNFKRIGHNHPEIKTVGIIGTKDAFVYIPQKIRDGLEDMGIKLIEFSKFFSRQDIIDFYSVIDIQLVWRPYKKLLSNPLKIINASSFGIPTIALDEPVFKEVEGTYIPVKTPEGFLGYTEELVRSKKLYNEYSKTCVRVAERYHIDNIAKLYKQL